MQIADVMSRGVELVSPDATVQEAATKMAEGDIGAVLIGTDDEPAGILTDRDIILRVVVEGRDSTTLPVSEVMSSTLFTCREEDTVQEVFREMSERQVRRLPVFDQNGKLSGIVALSDLGRLERDSRLTSEALREIADPHRRRSIKTDAPDDAR